jgi:aldose 1-epimerase
MTANTITLESDIQRLVLAPELGGGVAAWDWKSGTQPSPLFRPWDGISCDRHTLSCFPLVPWSNRISQGGFEHEGVFHPIHANRTEAHFPIHGDGWLQPWQLAERTENRIKLVLESRRFDGTPFHYRSTQTFLLQPSGLQIDLTVTHLGPKSLPYGLGLHPCFVRSAQTRLMFKADSVWLSNEDAVPAEHTTNFPRGWNFNAPAPLEGAEIDNCYTGWNGKAVIEYPDRALTLTMVMPDCNGYVVLRVPRRQDYFFLEPVTHPVDAFHMPNQAGLAFLSHGDSLALRTRFLISASETA